MVADRTTYGLEHLHGYWRYNALVELDHRLSSTIFFGEETKWEQRLSGTAGRSPEVIFVAPSLTLYIWWDEIPRAFSHNYLKQSFLLSECPLVNSPQFPLSYRAFL